MLQQFCTFLPLFWFAGGLAWDIGRLAGWGVGWGVCALRAEAPSVTDFSVIPWYVPIVSILKPSVSEKKWDQDKTKVKDKHWNVACEEKKTEKKL